MQIYSNSSGLRHVSGAVGTEKKNYFVQTLGFCFTFPCLSSYHKLQERFLDDKYTKKWGLVFMHDEQWRDRLRSAKNDF